MTTLHIDITIKDLPTFRTSFGEHADIRRQAGVEGQRVSQVVGHDGRLQIELDFASGEQAEAFLGYLRETLWKDNPAIDGTPQATVLEPLALQPA